jgi:hypothetical protein|nr:DUF3304 domain-containing protein [Halomonas sp. UBA3074]
MLARWAISRYMRLIPVWLQVSLAALVIIWLVWGMVFNTSKSGSLVGYNHTDRPLFRYFVDGNYGGNGGTTCCWSFEGDSVEVVWVLDVTPEDIEAGLEEEEHRVTLKMPEYSRDDQYLHVHFLPDNRVDLIWSHNIRSPKLDQYRRAGDERNE